jgi:transcriptional regulator with XRE-family HTH domain
MPVLTLAERLHQMPFGAQVRVAEQEGVSKQYVSKVMNDEMHVKTPAAQEKLRRVQIALAEELGLPVDDVFAPLPTPQTHQEAPPLAARAS